MKNNKLEFILDMMELRRSKWKLEGFQRITLNYGDDNIGFLYDGWSEAKRHRITIPKHLRKAFRCSKD